MLQESQQPRGRPIVRGRPRGSGRGRRSTRANDGEITTYPRSAFIFADSKKLKKKSLNINDIRNQTEKKNCSECVICYDTNSVYSSKTFIKTECNHIFCTDCLIEWSKKNCNHYNGRGFYTTCPYCRADVKCGEDYTKYEEILVKLKELMREPKKFEINMRSIESIIDNLCISDLKLLSTQPILNKINNVDLTLEEIKLTGKTKLDLQIAIRHRIDELYKLYRLIQRGK
jgi:hypothetical protein